MDIAHEIYWKYYKTKFKRLEGRKTATKAVLTCQSNQSKNNHKYRETDDHLDS